MNFKTTIVLAVLVAVGLALWLFLPGEASKTADLDKPKPEPKKTALLDPQPKEADIHRLIVERPDKPRLVFERGPRPENPEFVTEWKMVEPAQAAVEAFQVNNLLSAFARLESESLASSVSAQDAGLEPPLGRATLVDKAGKETVIEIGRKGSISNDTYVRVGGTTAIHSVAKDLAREIGKNANEFRSRSLARFSPGEAVRIEASHDDRTYDLSRNERGQWVIDAPVKGLADAEKVKAWINKITALSAADFVADKAASLAAFGMEPPFLKLAVTTEQKKPRLTTQPTESQPASQPVEIKRFELVFGQEADLQKANRFVKLADQPWVATIAGSLVDGLVPKLAELRDTRVARVREPEVTRLEITTEGQTAALERSDGAWRGAGDLTALEPAAVQDVVQALEDLRALEFIDEPDPKTDYGLSEPRSTLRITARGAEEPVVLKIGANTKSGRNTYVQVEGRPTVMVVAEAQAARLGVTPLALRARGIFDLQPDDLRSIDLKRGERHFVLQRDGAEWKMTAPPGAPVDPTGIRELTNDLARLRARRVVATGGGREYGLEKPVATIAFTAREPVAPAALAAPETQPAGPPTMRDVSHRLTVGRVENVTYVRRDDDPLIYELDATVYPVFVQELINRQLLDLPPEQIVGLRVDSTGGSIEFARDAAGEWTYPPDPTVKLIQKKVKDFMAELAKLRVDSFIAFENADLAALGLDKAPATVVLTFKDKPPVTLKLDQAARGELPRKAGWVEQRRAFMLRQGDIERLMRPLDFYVTPEPPPEPAAAPPGMSPPGMPQPGMPPQGMPPGGPPRRPPP